MNDARRLTRSRKNRMIGGVCGGLAEFFGWQPTSMRVLYVVVSILSAAGPGRWGDRGRWSGMPEEPSR